MNFIIKFIANSSVPFAGMTGVLSSCQRRLASLTADSARDANLHWHDNTLTPIVASRAKQSQAPGILSPFQGSGRRLYNIRICECMRSNCKSKV